MNSSLDSDGFDTVTLTLDDDEQVECVIIDVFPAGDRQYIALLPLDDDGEQASDEVYLYRYIDNGDEKDPDLENIAGDEEFKLVADAFDKLLDTMESDEQYDWEDEPE